MMKKPGRRRDLDIEFFGTRLFCNPSDEAFLPASMSHRVLRVDKIALGLDSILREATDL